MKKCPTGKRLYASETLAEDALIEARTQFDYAAGQGPVGVYLCDECGQYHLTSKGTMNPRLAEHLADGRIARQKEANKWMDKWRKK